LARIAGVSISTVDRVLNGRDPVRRDKAERVLAVADDIGFRATGVLRHRIGVEPPERTFAFMLQQPSDHFYSVLGAALTQATKTNPLIRGQARVDFVDMTSPDAAVAALHRAARTAHGIAVVAADHPLMSDAITDLRAKGVPVIAMIADLSAENRAGYVGLDNGKVGRTAAWSITRLCRGTGKVGISLGSHRILSQEASEISFRSYLREHAPAFEVLESLINFEQIRYAHETTRDLLRRHPDLVGLFVAGGGLDGVMQAVRDEGAAQRIVCVGRELTPLTRFGLIDGTLSAVISHPLKMMAEAVVTALIRAATSSQPLPFQQVILPTELHVRENI
jgi:LacI family transcriptional regulator